VTAPESGRAREWRRRLFGESHREILADITASHQRTMLMLAEMLRESEAMNERLAQRLIELGVDPEKADREVKP
jgi:hypothetical protein